MAPDRRAAPPAAGSATGTGSPDDAPDRTRGLIVTLLLLALGIGIIAALPGQHVRHTAGSSVGSHHDGGHSSTSSTTQPVGTSTTTAPPTTGPKTNVGVLAPSGSSSLTTVQSKLTAAGYVLEAEQPIPYSWVAGLTTPFVRYPPGYESQASSVAHALGVPSSDVQPDLPGGSIGSDVIEVFVPA